MSKQKIVFIGGGNMASALIGGLLAADYPAEMITVVEPQAGQRDYFLALGVEATDSSDVVAQAEVLVLAVKPQVMAEVCAGLAANVQAAKPLVVSVAAGVRCKAVEHWLGGDIALVRCMPNTPALVSAGASGLFANAQVTTFQHELAESLLRAVGVIAWVQEEDQLDTVTALSGSGPAYYFRFMEAQIEAAIAQGLDPQTARLLTLETAYGAAKMALESEDPPGLLRQKVTSPKGTTQRALEIFEAGGLSDLIAKAMDGARERSVELADELGKTNPEAKQ